MYQNDLYEVVLLPYSPVEKQWVVINKEFRTVEAEYQSLTNAIYQCDASCEVIKRFELDKTGTFE